MKLQEHNHLGAKTWPCYNQKRVIMSSIIKGLECIEDITIDPNGVKKLLDCLNPNKASGPDDLSVRMLKECSAEIAQVLACIFNQSLIHATVPDDWRQANLAPIYKKGEKYDTANYRPVSLTCMILYML